MILGDMLVAYRKEVGVSLRQISKTIGVDHSALCRIENGRPCDMVTLIRLINWMTDYGSNNHKTNSKD